MICRASIFDLCFAATELARQYLPSTVNVKDALFLAMNCYELAFFLSFYDGGGVVIERKKTQLGVSLENPHRRAPLMPCMELRDPS